MANALELKKINTDKVKAALKTKQSFTKNILADATGLSIATCGNILSELVKRNEVFEIEKAESTGGRPSRQFVYNKDYAYVLIMYIRIENNSQFVYYAVKNLFDETIAEDMREYKKVDINTVDEILSSTLNMHKNIESVSVGIPGVVAKESIGICDIKDLSNLDLKGHIENKYTVNVEVINDVNCTAFGYYKNEDYPNNESLVYIYYPDLGNPGAGIIIDGKVVSGVSNFAGEVAFLPHYLFDNNQRLPQKDVSEFVEKVFCTLISVISIINPKGIILSGFQFNDEIIMKLRNLIKEYIPCSEDTEITFVKDIHENYVRGLSCMALEKI